MKPEYKKGDIVIVVIPWSDTLWEQELFIVLKIEVGYDGDWWVNVKPIFPRKENTGIARYQFLSTRFIPI